MRKGLAILVLCLLFISSIVWGTMALAEPRADGNEWPEGAMSVGELSENPVYDAEVIIYGEVGLLGEVRCPCFQLTSGEKTVPVWYDLMVDDDGTRRPPVDVEGIGNGDDICVTGELRPNSAFWATYIVEKGPLDLPMSMQEAMAIARASSRVSEVSFTGKSSYNDSTGTWWLELDIEKEGCSPHCVVNVDTGEVEINWMCTGVLPPDDKTDGVDVAVPLIDTIPSAIKPDSSETPPEPSTAIAPVIGDEEQPTVIDRPRDPDDGPISVKTVVAPIESVEVLIMESFPPQYSIRVVSGLPGSCVSFGAYNVERAGKTIRINVINRLHSEAGVACAEIYGIVEMVIPLGSDFESGVTYTAYVNDVSTSFTAE